MKVERNGKTTTRFFEETPVLVDGKPLIYVTELVFENISESGQAGKAPVSGTGNA